MLKNAMHAEKGIDYKERAKELREQLSVLQLKMKEKSLPAIIVFEGWGASGKGTLIADTIKMLDPRFFKVVSTVEATEAEKRYPRMKRYFENIPEYGKLSVMDRSWYRELAAARLEEGISGKEYARRTESVKTFERQLTDDGYVIIKIFLHISKEEQKKRYDKLSESGSTSWRVTAKDIKQNKHYDEYFDAFEDMLSKTNTDNAPWYVIDATDKQYARYALFELMTTRLSQALEKERICPPEEDTAKLFPMKKTPKLSQVVLTGKTVEQEEYAAKLKELQKELAKLHGKLYKKKIPVIIAFEG